MGRRRHRRRIIIRWQWVGEAVWGAVVGILPLLLLGLEGRAGCDAKTMLIYSSC